MKLSKFLPVAAAAAMMIGSAAQASIVFQFTEAAGTVTMTSSGVLDTSKLVLLANPAGWGGTGIENNGTPGDIDIMGGTSFGGIDLSFGFHAGTDASAITNLGGPFTFSHFSVASINGSKSFTTYSGFSNGKRMPGVGLRRDDLVGALWTPDQTWVYSPGTTFASLGLVSGTYAVSDALTGETVTILIGDTPAVPEPATLALLGLGLAGLAFTRRRKG